MPTLHWIGKEKVINHNQELPFRILEKQYTYTNGTQTEEKEKTSENKIIHGDNLEALKSLFPEYEGKIKCIYIDPPYNTGNESWVYNDNVNDPKIKKWLGQVVGKESEDLSRHDKWLCMMYPRLKLLHKLLANDGVIFISIDDNEVSNLRIIMDEIFGYGNFKNHIIVKRGTKSVQAQFDNIDKLGIAYEYIICYSKGINYRLPQFHFDLDEKRPGIWNNHWRGTNRPTMRYELFGIIPEKGQWRWSKERSLKAIENYIKCEKYLKDKGRDINDENIDLWYFENIEEGAKIDLLRLSKNNKPEHYIPPTEKKFGNNLWTDLTSNGSTDLNNILTSKFDNPKNPKIIERIINWVCSKNDIVLDSFAGSGTTAHAVLKLNKQDGGNRKFILVEMEDYAESITAERVKRVISGYGEENKAVEGTGGDFSYYELGKPLFLEENILNEEVEEEKIREYIWYSEVKTTYQKQEENYLLGKQYQTVYYFYYNKDKLTTLDENFLRTLKTKAEQYIIYADNCLLDADFMNKHSLIFKKIPRDITRF